MQKITDSIGNKGIISLIFGRSGSGKTASCRNLPPEKTCFISFELDQTASCLFGWKWDKWNCETPAGYMSMDFELDRIRRDNDIRYVVIDTISGYVEMLLDEYCQAHPEKTRNQLGFSLWTTVEERLFDTFTKLQTLAAAGKHVILLCHLKYREEGEDKEKKVYREPMLFGQLPEKLCKRIPVVLIAKAFKMGPNLVYTLSTVGNEGDYGADKFRILNPSQENCMKAILDKIEQGLGLPPTPILPIRSVHSFCQTSSETEQPKGTPHSSQSTKQAPALLVKTTKKSLTDEIYRLGGELGHDPPLVRVMVKARFDRNISQLNREELREFIDELQEKVDQKDKELKEAFQ